MSDRLPRPRRPAATFGRMLRRYWGVLAAAVCMLAMSAYALATAGAGAAQGNDTLLGNQTLTAGHVLTSADGRYELAMQSDGNLVLYLLSGSAVHRALWSSGTQGNTGDHALLQGNGSLVVLDGKGQTLWSTNTSTAGCTDLVVQNDGNLVLYPSSMKAVWASGSQPTVLLGGDELLPGQTIYAPGEQYRLVMQGDGNLVLYDDAGAALWSTRTQNHPGSHAVMSNGILSVLDASGHPLYATPTSGYPNADAAVQSDGNLVIYNGSKALWDTATNASRPTGPVLFHKPTFQACPPPASSSSTTTTTTTTTTVTAPPTAPVVTTPVVSPTPRRLRVKMVLSWTWNHRTTRLHRIQIPHMPRRATLTVTCRGRGCARRSRRSDRRHLGTLIHYLDGHAFRAGERVMLVISETGYRAERVEADIRNGRLPRVRLLR